MTPQPPNPKRLMRVKPAADYLSFSPGKVRDMVQKGELPFICVGDHAPWLLDVKDLDAWIASHKKKN